MTVYECGNCGSRTLGEQRCEPCGTFMSRVGMGGCCPSCDEPIAVAELVDQEVAP
jgi:DNA polymerase II large subunit